MADATPDLADAHARPADDVAAALGVDPRLGLTDAAAGARLAVVGRNQLEAPRRPSPWAAAREAVSEPFILLLAAAGLTAIALGEVRDGLFMLVAWSRSWPPMS